MSTRHVELARASGALTPLSIALNGRGQVATHCGDFETAASLAAEKDVVNQVTGTLARLPPAICCWPDTGADRGSGTDFHGDH